MKRQKPRHEKGAALVMVLQLTVVGALMVGGIAFLVTSQTQHNFRTLRSEKALWVAETGVQRFMAGFRNDNDCVTKTISENNLNNTCTGYWLNNWIPVHDENNKVIGEYRVSMLPGNIPAKKIIKSEGKVYASKNGSTEINMVKRVVGAQLERFSLDNFAIASNNQLGGARINGGARIHGGIFTSGRLGLDAASTGIYNDYNDLNDNQNFQGYPAPVVAPRAEVFVYKDNQANPPPTPNGGVEIAAQADLGTSTNPLKGLHTDSSVVDPGTGGNPDPLTVGDSVVGNGEDTQVYADKRDHELPAVNFPDASASSQYMADRLAEAQTNGCVRNSPLVLDNTTVAAPGGAGCGSKFTYTVSGNTRLLHIQGPVFIYGNVTMNGLIQYTGQGAIFVIGSVTAVKGLEPLVPSDYPNNAALGIVASDDLSLTEGNGSSVKYAGSFFGNRNLNIEMCKIFGNIFGGKVNLPTTGTRPDVYVHPEVRSKVGVPMPDFENSTVTKAEWWEMYGRAAK
ncbi:MAG: hypothetical protein IV090_08825 [Candidatus Sericytochromatia bacterium]|nr:hypothetical protein [Candidatus Sericytochromatia bacterium]